MNSTISLVVPAQYFLSSSTLYFFSLHWFVKGLDPWLYRKSHLLDLSGYVHIMSLCLLLYPGVIFSDHIPGLHWSPLNYSLQQVGLAVRSVCSSPVCLSEKLDILIHSAGEMTSPLSHLPGMLPSTSEFRMATAVFWFIRKIYIWSFRWSTYISHMYLVFL